MSAMKQILSEHVPRKHNSLTWVECSCSPEDWFEDIGEWGEHLVAVTLDHARNLKRCPRCGSYIPSDERAGEGKGALSRWDNRTEVCSECGMREALIVASGEFITPVNEPLPPGEPRV